jgi:TIR domain-containing protein/uncharacterized protein DUF4384
VLTHKRLFFPQGAEVFSHSYDQQAVSASPPDLFISYARRDYEQVRRVTEQFAAMEVSFWLDQRDIDGGENFAEVIARSIKLSRVFVLMCSDAALRSRNVKQEINLAWNYERQYLPLMLERVSFPEQVEYFLTGVQWIEILDQPINKWWPLVEQAITRLGISITGTRKPLVNPAPPEGSTASSSQPEADLTSLRALASFNDCIWPIAADRIPGSQQPRVSFRSLGAPQRDAQRTYEIGSRLGLAIWAERAGHLVLIDEGQDGTIYCLCPSWFAPDTRVDKGMNYLPQTNARYQSFELSGEPGREQLLAVITNEPLTLNWLSSEARSPARVLNTQDVELLLTQLRQLNPASWVALATYFDVVR